MLKTHHNKKIAFIIGLILILVFLYINSESNNDSNSKAVLHQKTMINEALTKIVKPDSKTKTKAEVEKNYSQKQELFMVDHNDYRPFHLDDLLDPNDRTIESERAIFNYNNLLEITHTINALKNETLSIDDISVDDIQTWVKILIYDVYYRNAKYSKLFNTIDLADLADLDKIDASYLPSEDELSERMSKIYLNKLKDFSSKSLDQNESITWDEKLNLIHDSTEFAREVKSHSNGFFSSKIKKYFKSNNYSVMQKIDFAEVFLNAKDETVLMYLKVYVGYLETITKDMNSKLLINEFKSKLK